MTVAEILNGHMKERTFEDARNGIPMTEQEVRWVISKMEAETKSKSARKRMAELGAKNIAGKISNDGVELYKKYLETF